MSDLGDFNGDGYSDIIIGFESGVASGLDSYVLFGGPWLESVDRVQLPSLNGIDGFRMNNTLAWTVGSAGDFNQDGFDDLLIGSKYAGTANEGIVTILFGGLGVGGLHQNSVALLDGNNGFRVNGYGSEDNFCGTIDGVGDVDLDGIDDLLVGLPAQFNNMVSSAFIIFGKNAVPTFVNNQLTIIEGERVNITANELSAIDLNNDDKELTFEIRNLQNGRFGSVNTAGDIVQFSQKNITDGDIFFEHDGGEVPPIYEVIVGDGVSSSPSSSAIISYTPINDPPVIDRNSFTIVDGQPLIVTTTQLHATDPDNDDASLIFTVSNMQNGQMGYINNPGIPVTVFAQKKIIDTDIYIDTDGSGLSPSFNISVTDGSLSTPTESAVINFNPGTTVNANPGEDNTIRNAIIGSVVSGVVGLGFFALRFWINRKAQQRMQAALLGKGGDDRDQEFMQEAVLPIAKAVLDAMKVSGFLGHISEQSMRDYIEAIKTVVSKVKARGIEIRKDKLEPDKYQLYKAAIVDQICVHCTTPGHGCGTRVSLFFKPEVTPGSINRAADAIAAGVAAKNITMSSKRGGKKRKHNRHGSQSDDGIELGNRGSLSR